MSEEQRIKFIDRILSNKKKYKRLIMLLAFLIIAGTIAGLILFTPFEYKDKKEGKIIKKGSVLDYKNNKQNK